MYYHAWVLVMGATKYNWGIKAIPEGDWIAMISFLKWDPTRCTHRGFGEWEHYHARRHAVV